MTATIPLGDLVEIKGGGTPSRAQSTFWDGPIPWATVKDFKTTTLDRTIETITEAGLNNSSANLIPAGSIIVPTRMAVGKAAINNIDIAINQDLKALLPNAAIDRRFLLHFLVSKSEFLNSRAQGATVKGIKLDVLRELPVPDLPTSEQQRIAAILDKADAIRRRREEALSLADAFLRSVFLDMFGDPVTNQRGYRQIPLGEIIKVSSGNGLTARMMDPEGKYPVYGGNGINGCHAEYMFEEPQIVIGRVGVYCGAVHVSKPKSWITDNALYVKEFRIPINRTYLEWALRFADLNQYAGRAAQPLISGSRIYPVEIVVPDDNEQAKFECVVHQHEELVASLRSASAKANDLFGSLAQRAFHGEL
ncbi:restriction endonuclease subunit S [Erythrobacter aurantius]|uniref:restriction endonuclease subunit S n=1 Tax=Erythrobacter aurantius TaxID=2909249 RepID=UPI00207AA3CD|nr:restriction endonuclease subunit S [Erythrobacter aurantius]